MLLIASGCSDDDNGTGPGDVALDPIVISIENIASVDHGEFVNVSVMINETASLPYEMGGFDFLITYDSSALDLQTVQRGQLLYDWGWEYFSYQYGGTAGCGGSPCPDNYFRVLAIADSNNGPDNHPSAFSGEAGELLNMVFLVSNDTAYDCTHQPIQFAWYDCPDNNISSRGGDSTFLSHHVYDYNNTSIQHNSDFPTVFGAPDTCGTAVPDRTPRLVTYRHGGIDIGCPAGVDNRGDINLNGVRFEIADFVLFSNTLLYGFGVLTDSAASTAASDVNADGNVWTLTDLVYLERIVTGDAGPFPPASVDTVDATVGLTGGTYSADVGTGSEIGAALVYIEGNVTPTLLASNMEMYYVYDGADTRILVFSTSSESFTGSFLDVTGNLVSIEMATIDGDAVNVSGP